MTDAISIEETNRIRAALGLKLLPVPGRVEGPTFRDRNTSRPNESTEADEDQGSTLESRQGAAYDNWKRLQEEASSKAARDAKSESVKKARDASRRFTKLEGKGLGEVAEGEDELDARAWLSKQRKRQRQIEKARRLEQELAERERAAARGTEHTAEDLAGVKVGHELDDFEEGGEQVLTLKDATLDENEEEGDELENMDLREKEKLTERLESKKKKLTYNPNDDDESGDKSILAQYDAEIEGKKRKVFTLTGQRLTSEEKEAMKEEAKEKLKAQPVSLDIARELPSSHSLS